MKHSATWDLGHQAPERRTAQIPPCRNLEDARAISVSCVLELLATQIEGGLLVCSAPPILGILHPVRSVSFAAHFAHAVYLPDPQAPVS